MSLQCRSAFPGEVCVLEIHDDLSWNADVVTLSSSPLFICDDGVILFYRFVHFFFSQAEQLKEPIISVYSNYGVRQVTIGTSSNDDGDPDDDGKD